MIQTVRLIRKKTEDILALYIIEFFKFIGCIVSDYVLHDMEKAKVGLDGFYDAEILLNIGVQELSICEELGFHNSDRSHNIKAIISTEDDIIANTGHSKILKDIVYAIWDKQPELEEILYLAYAYAKSNVFFYLYNEGNLKFIQEYYPIEDKEKMLLGNSRKIAYSKSFYRFASCNNLLVEFKRNPQKKLSVYYEYALLSMRYKINEMIEHIEEKRMFSLEGLLEKVEDIRKKEPDFARINYLAGSICKSDSEYWYDVEFYYSLLVKSLKKIELPEKDYYFLYYQWGRFFEKRLKDIDAAYHYYSKAFMCNRGAYRALYKLMQKKAREGEFSKVVKGANAIIDFLLNGYGLKDIMPKQKIYGYKCFALMGDCYFEQGSYDLAIKCYKNAERISQSKNDFYDILQKKDEQYFEENFRACMPVRPMYYNIISCASKGNDRDIIDAYFEKI